MNNPMNDFNRGWWNCFLTVFDELHSIAPAQTATLDGVALAAGVTIDEVDAILVEPFCDDNERKYLEELKGRLKRVQDK